METYSTVQKLVYRYRYQHTKDVCPSIANCITEFEIIFHGLIFWQFLFIPPIVYNLKYPPNIRVSH